jgi:microcystin-dependent protein
MEPILGMIYLFGGNFAPTGYALCNGELLPISQNTALFAILGTTYGGDGKTTFGVPKLSGPAPGTNYLIALRGIFPSRS